MKTIWKFRLTSTTICVSMPKGARVLCMQAQGDVATLWAEVDPEAKREDRYFRIYGTGHGIAEDESDREYVGTYQLHSGSLVFHVFEIKGA